MNTRRIAVVSLSAAALFALAGIEASAAQADVVAPTSAPTPAIFVATDPPGPCLSSELGQRKRARDGKLYECKIVGSSNA